MEKARHNPLTSYHNTLNLEPLIRSKPSRCYKSRASSRERIIIREAYTPEIPPRAEPLSGIIVPVYRDAVNSRAGLNRDSPGQILKPISASIRGPLSIRHFP